MAQRTLFGWLRLVILLTILLVVGLNAWFDRALTTDWDLPLRVTIYPLAADDENAAFASRLEADDFAAIDAFFATQAALYGVEIEEPVRIRVSHAARSAPPTRARGAGVVSTVPVKGTAKLPAVVILPVPWRSTDATVVNPPI